MYRFMILTHAARSPALTDGYGSLSWLDTHAQAQGRSTRKWQTTHYPRHCATLPAETFIMRKLLLTPYPVKP